ncbi:MAG TPA: hypothetical protein VER03_16355 [Bryobacteraceae bacterium]|nr:hypothetical protein [Bryobacteraceae bacterium]
MNRESITEEEVYRFILLQIDTVPHLEALLLLWRNRPRLFTEQDLARQLFVDVGKAHEIARDLDRSGLITINGGDPQVYCYETKDIRINALMEALAALYKRELVSISQLIHSKAPSAARDFARAFKFTKDRD